MPLEHKFLINDESVNRYGYRILSSGINTENFLKNPVCLVSHEGKSLSIGKWKDLKIEGKNFSATLEFDEKDPLAVMIANKYAKGYMNACSLSMLELEDSSDPTLLLPGQKYPTVTKCELLEISIVNVPGNANAITLLLQNGEEKKLSLIDTNENSNKNRNVMTKEEELKAENEQLKNQRALELVATHVKMGAVPEVSKGFYENSAKLDYEGTKTALEALPSKEDQNVGKKELAAQLVEMHQKRGAINAQQLDFYTKSAESDYEGTKKVLEGMKGTDGLGDFVKSLDGTKGSEAEDKSKWTYLDWYKNDLEGLQKMETEKPDQHKKLLLECRAGLQKEGVMGKVEEV